MPGTGERSYAYVKACGNIGKSFVGSRIAPLKNVNRLSELDRLIFPSDSRDLPEKELLKDIEKRINIRAADSILAIVNSFRNPPEFLVLLIQAWEFQDVKNILTALENKETEKPAFLDIGRFRTINISAWPDINVMLHNTKFRYLLPMLGRGRDFLQTELDRLYYTTLWKALQRLRRSDRQTTEMILAEEIALRNAVWALRLKTYYQMPDEEIKTHLIHMNVSIRGKKFDLTADALSALELPLDHREAWAGWKRRKFLNQETSSGWKLDPRFFQNSAALYLYRLACRSWRNRPFSLDSVFCFIKIKQFEEEILISSAEGLGMGMESADVFSMIGIKSSGAEQV